jgi:hypothetical protein
MRFSEPGMHTRGHASDRAWSRHMQRLAETLDSPGGDVAVDTRTRQERMVDKARGHPDRRDVQAAQNICKKNGWEY